MEHRHEPPTPLLSALVKTICLSLRVVASPYDLRGDSSSFRKLAAAQSLCSCSRGGGEPRLQSNPWRGHCIRVPDNTMSELRYGSQFSLQNFPGIWFWPPSNTGDCKRGPTMFLLPPFVLTPFRRSADATCVQVDATALTGGRTRAWLVLKPPGSCCLPHADTPFHRPFKVPLLKTFLIHYFLTDSHSIFQMIKQENL